MRPTRRAGLPVFLGSLALPLALPLALLTFGGDEARSAGPPAARAREAAVARAKPRPAPSEAPPAPLSMSDPDGQELVLEELTVRAAVHGMLSLTELDMRFRNPHPRRMEGRFTAVLPAGAAISRFAKSVRGSLMEGEVVERLRAHRVYDTILHEMRDPALLESDQGNRFSARVFPIEANDTVRLVLSYSRVLPLEDGVRTYALPLRGLPRIGRFAFHGLFAPLPGERRVGDAAGGERRVGDASTAAGELRAQAGARTSTAKTVEVDESDFTPQKDLLVSFRREPGAPEVETLTAGDFVLTAFHPRLPEPRAPSAPGGWLFLVDTSASAADGMVPRVEALEDLLAALPAGDRVRLVAFDQEVADLGSDTAAAWAGKVGKALGARGFLGGTDLAAALGKAASIVAGEAGTAAAPRVVLVSDGVATLGATGRPELLAAAAKLPPGAPLHALVLGSRQDAETLGTLVHGRGRVVEVPFSEGLRERAGQAALALGKPLGVELSAEDPACEWSYPSSFADVQPGSELIVLGRLKPGAAPAARLVAGGRTLARVNGAARALPAASFAPLLEREAYRASLASLAEREAREKDPAVRDALATEQVRISVERRILVPRTTLLVLESEEDYRRFGLDRRALAEILTVGPSGIERLDRPALTFTSPGVVPPREAERKDVSSGDARRDALVRAQEADDEKGKGEASSEGAPKVAERSAPARNAAEPLADAVAGGVEGGVEGGVAGGVLGGAAGAVRQNAAPSATQATVTGPGPRDRRPAWTEPFLPADADVARLEEAVKAQPRDRTGYTLLSEALASRKEWKKLRALAVAWQPLDPENAQVYEALGEAALALGRKGEAARAFGSLVEIAGGKPELLQRAGLLLFRAGDAAHAEAPLRRAVELRPDRVNAHRHLALVLWRLGRHAEAARVLEEASARNFPGWYGNARRVVLEELGYVYRGWIAAEPGRRDEVERRAKERGIDLARTDALRVTLAWETDANDVDLHVVDPAGEECFYSHRQTRAGLELYEDVTQGFGPEVVRTGRLVPGTYSVGVNYFSSGPMGVSRGVVVVMKGGTKGKGPEVSVVPFRLVPVGRDMRLLAEVTVR